ncbi:HlyD family type I secretion periplasmic adaptor subunit [Rhizobium sp. P40RR-XXII]|uniref:HlyD family type I secretion periplasmic adaptor subunit n=1 Tax=unclassified Rhizobium TaxID=2613769 RepID=UPI0014572815|nr:MULTISPECIES: HlyD family type I secretion periplasmic adaptor subunit [unclassified Rhizobium]NLR86792.1 HlyD family type I secretion periplasmic adaptor subunit [Rhizobium sp. P28RR-XV]NLS17463.1 HlyD family type I secretion periplasmic adaptor subunit [Rhizobium sp. P40RR-XXII]
MTLVHLDAMLTRLSNSSRTGRRFAQRSTATGKQQAYSPVTDAKHCGPAPPSPMPRLRGVVWTGNLLIGVFIVGLGIWSVLAPLKSAAIAPGVVEPESSRKTIQHLEGGIVRRILVKNGDAVTAGQIIIELDDTKSRSERDSIQGQLWDAEASRARLLVEQTGGDHVDYPQGLRAATDRDPAVSAILTGQQKIFEARRQVMQAEVGITNEKIAQVRQEIVGLGAQKAALTDRGTISREELDQVTLLNAKGLERKSRLLNLQREKADLDGQQGQVEAQISRAYQVISESQADLAKLESDRLSEVAQGMRDTESQIMQLRERLRAIDDQLSRTDIRAPDDGIIMNLRIHTAGGVIGAGEPLVDLLPRADRLVVSAHVRPEDINLVHAGLEAQVHLLPYNQRRVPLLKGRVEYVSADRLTDTQSGQPYFAATIRVTDERLAKMSDVELVAGMPAQALIETGKSSVAFYAVRPLLDSFNRAFREE